MTEQLTEKFNGKNILRKGVNSYKNLHNEIEYLDGEAIDKLAKYEIAEDERRLVVLPCDTVYFICDKGTEYAFVTKKSIRDLFVYEIDGIDKKGRYWSNREKAEKALKEVRNERD